MKFRIEVEPSEEGGHTAIVLSLPGGIREGEEVQKAMENIEEAIGPYLERIEDDLVTSEHALV